jgi:hypothetical protein
MSDMLTEKGKSPGLLYSPGWTISRINVEQMAANISRRLEEVDPAVVILQLLDNSAFFSKTEDGSRQMPRQDPAGRFHLEGELRVCASDVQEDQFRALKPIFDVLGRKKCILVAPIPRYVVAGCCGSSGHVTNRLEPYYLEDMQMQLDGYRRHLKEHLFIAGRKNIRLYDPSHDLRRFTTEQTWDEDPIHPTKEVLSKMADSLVAMVDNLVTSESERSGAVEADPGLRARQDLQPRDQRNRWPGPSRGGHFHPYIQNDDFNRGRHNPPDYPRGGRGGRGGHNRGRARPY